MADEGEYSYTYESVTEVEGDVEVIPIKTKTKTGRKSIQKKNQPEAEVESKPKQVNKKRSPKKVSLVKTVPDEQAKVEIPPVELNTKRPRTQAQIDALARAQETRRRNIEARNKLKNEVETLKKVEIEKAIEKKVSKKIKKEIQQDKLTKTKKRLVNKINDLISTHSGSDNDETDYIPVKKSKKVVAPPPVPQPVPVYVPTTADMYIRKLMGI